MQKIGINFLLAMSLWQAHARCVEQSLGVLSQSLELLSKSIVPVEKPAKEPWILPEFFKVEGSETNSVITLDPNQKFIRGSEKSKKILKDSCELLQAILKEISTHKYEYDDWEDVIEDFKRYNQQWDNGLQAPIYKKNVDDSIAKILDDLPIVPPFELAKQLLIVLFYKESIDPGSWLNNFDSKIKNPKIKEKWNQFMNAFREKMKAEGWPYAKDS